MKPFVRWAGGKRALIKTLKEYFPKKIDRLVEPFVGGGSVFMSISPESALLNDYNSQLINLYKTIQTDLNTLVKHLDKFKSEYTKSNNKEKYYYDLREMERHPDFQKKDNAFKAARMLFLNKTNFNGLFRVNGAGYYDVPWGHKLITPSVYELENLKEISEFLKKKTVKLKNKTFYSLLPEIEAEDFVYLDPPYDKKGNSTFTAYNHEGFTRSDQTKLKQFCDELNKKGIKFLQSNSDTDFIKELYKDYTIVPILAPRSINSDASNRKNIKEILIMNYKKD